MTQMTNDVNRIVERIASAKYKYKSYTTNDYYDAPIVSSDAIPTLQNILNEELAEICLRKAELEAKCFAYEAIINNSNFKPVITSGKSDGFGVHTVLLNSKGGEI